MICKLLHCLFLRSCYIIPLFTLRQISTSTKTNSNRAVTISQVWPWPLKGNGQNQDKHLHHLQHKDYDINVGIYMIICTQGIHIYFIITLLLLSLPNHYVDYITNSFSRLNILRGLFIVLSWHVFMCVCCVCVIYLFDWQPNQLQNLLSVISVCRLVIFEAWMRWITYTPCQLKELNG